MRSAIIGVVRLTVADLHDQKPGRLAEGVPVEVHIGADWPTGLDLERLAHLAWRTDWQLTVVGEIPGAVAHVVAELRAAAERDLAEPWAG